VLGNEHPAVAVAQSRLADLLQREGKLEEAVTLANEALASSKKSLVDGDAWAVEPLATLVSILLARHKDAEAEHLLGDLLKPTQQAQPQNVGVLRVQSIFFARCRRWKEAVATLSKVVELDASAEDDQFNLAVLLLEIGDTANYRIGCQKMLTNFGAANHISPLARTAEACLLMPEPDSESARQLADRAFTLGKDSSWLYYLQLVKAMAEYRAGNFSNAVDWLGKTIGQPAFAGFPQPDAAAYATLAMAQHKLNHSDEARAALARSVDILNKKIPKLENGTLDENWIDWVSASILVREARELIEGQPATH